MENKKRKMLSKSVADGLPGDFEFNPEFARAFELMEGTSECILVTGKAGTGKSTLLQYFIENTDKNIVVLAPTGVAAINVGGQTIHSFFRFPPRFVHKETIRRRRDRETIKKIDAVIIDEVSMVRADLMDGIDWALRINRERIDIPFGGVQMIFFGDLFQLSPVVDKEMIQVYGQRYETPYFFSADVFRDVRVRGIELTRIYRQTDQRFVGLLNKIRNNECDEEDFKLLNSRVARRNSSIPENVITLTATNNLAGAINEARLNGLPGAAAHYNASVQDEFDSSSYPTEPCLKLKPGAQIMMIRNDPEKRWVNGSIGVVRSLTNDSILVEIEGERHQISPVSWEKISYTYNDLEDKIEERILGVFTQFPLKLAWAITIHKSQGQTFDTVFIDLGYGAFAHGQVYVALSRCTSLEGITLKRPVIYNDIVFDQRIHGFAEYLRK